jgi:hypothetical protein
MAEKSVLNKANDFWLNSKLSWFFKPWGCCTTRDDDLTHDEKHKSLPSKMQNMLPAQGTEENGELYEGYAHNPGYLSSIPIKADFSRPIGADRDIIPDYEDSIYHPVEKNNLITTHAYPQLQGLSMESMLEKGLDLITNIHNDQYNQSIPDTDSDSDSESASGSQVPSIGKKSIRKMKREPRKLDKKLKKSKTSRNPWQPHEDALLLELVKQYDDRWSLISQMIKGRSGKQVRDRYLNKLNPGINKSKWTTEEDQVILRLYHEKGSKWSEIAKHLKGRAESQVKNRFYSYIRKKYIPQDQLSQNNSTNKNYEPLNSSYCSMSVEQQPNTATTTPSPYDNRSKLGLNIVTSNITPQPLHHHQQPLRQGSLDMLISPGLPQLLSMNGGFHEDRIPSLPSHQGFNSFGELYNTNHELKFEDSNNQQQHDNYLTPQGGYENHLVNHHDGIVQSNGMMMNGYHNQQPQSKLFNLYKVEENQYANHIMNNNQIMNQLEYPGAGLSPQNSGSSPTHSSVQNDSDIDSSLNKLARLFEKNNLNLQELRGVDANSIVKSSGNNSEAPGSDHPLAKFERMELLKKRTELLTYLLSKTHKEIENGRNQMDIPENLM